MDISYVERMVNGYVEELFEPGKYLEFLNRDNKLNRFDLMERLSILSQLPGGASDIKTEVEWFIEGRKIISKAKPVYVMCSYLCSVYTDAETGDVVDDSTINPAQLDVGVKHGVIKKNIEIRDRTLVEMYDISSTEIIPGNFNDTNFNGYNKQFSIKDSLRGIFGVTFDVSDEDGDENDFYYHKSDNTVIMSKLPSDVEGKLLMELLSKLLIGLYMTEFKSGEHLRFVTDSVVYSIMTLRGEDVSGFKFRIGINEVRITKDELFNTLDVIQKCVDYVRVNIVGDTDSASEMVYKIRVAEQLKKVYQVILMKDRSILRKA